MVPAFEQRRQLFKLRRNARESRIQLRAETVHRKDDGACNAGGNQAIFNSSSARLCTPEPNEKFPHGGILLRDALFPELHLKRREL